MILMIYVSSAVGRLDGESLDRILEVSRRNNARDGISGALLYADGSFIQAIEGAPEAIDRLMARIDRDPRHRDLTVISRMPIDRRQFAEWSMGFRRFDGADAKALSDAVLDLSRPLADLAESRSLSVAHRLLERFRQTYLA